MALTFNTDVSTKILSNYLHELNSKINKNIERLSTGQKFSSIADDPAGYLKIERIDKNISNIENSIQKIQLLKSELTQRDNVRKNILSEIKNALEALEEYKKTTDENEKDILLDRYIISMKNVDELEKTKFNGKDLFYTRAPQNIDLGDGSIIVQDPFIYPPCSITFSPIKSNIKINLDLFINGAKSSINDNLNCLTKSEIFGQLIDSTAENLSNKITNYEQIKNAILSTDVANETAELTKNQILQKVTSSLLAQVSNNAYAALSVFKNNSF